MRDAASASPHGDPRWLCLQRMTPLALRLLPAAACALMLACGAHGPHLTRDAAARQAMMAAIKEGYTLRDYKLPVVRPPEGSQARWSVQFDALEGKPGGHLLVWVDDRTGDTQVVPGK